MKQFFAALCLIVSSAFLLSACVTTDPDAVPAVNPNMNASGTPSPLNTAANPWTQVNPQIQAQQQAARARLHR